MEVEGIATPVSGWDFRTSFATSAQANELKVTVTTYSLAVEDG